MTEIKIDYKALADVLTTLNELRTGRFHPTTTLINHGRGQTFQSVNELHAELIKIEDSFAQMVTKTVQALKNAGINFLEAEEAINQQLNKLNEVATGEGEK